MKKRRQSGLNVIVIMVIIAVIGLLAGIAIPISHVVRENNKKAEISTCISNLKQIYQAKNTWAVEHGKVRGDTPCDTDLFGYIGEKPTCPGGGTYTLGPIGEKPTCSIAGHKL